ncbi:hypothetical protein BJY24_000032 [Nocardia transvalensis]|uniref:Uncharacterized protein n=1 Tax=Nocardia transvalensis TaxID=37333 RepID=A0A7W9P842_9NOCA|nr:hypothetical protein [Nocardia transvalensis]MBB5911165.1 hypothetical protein [Nocardia transvalensis]
MDDLRRRVLTTVEHARQGLDPADARLLERRVVDLCAEIAGADYAPAERRRLMACCSEARAAARWAMGRPSTNLPPLRPPAAPAERSAVAARRTPLFSPCANTS